MSTASDPGQGNGPVSTPSWTLLCPYLCVCVQTWLLQTPGSSRIPGWRSRLRISLIPIVPSLVYLAHLEPACHFRPSARMILPNFMVYIYLTRCCFDALEVGFASEPYKWVGYSKAPRSSDDAGGREAHPRADTKVEEPLEPAITLEAMSISGMASLATR